jgi:rSAM/selenodomain-associated transferase 2
MTHTMAKKVEWEDPKEDPVGAIYLIVPLLNEEEWLPRFLEHHCPFSPSPELILVDGGSTDASESIAKKWKCQWLPAPKGRAKQMNRALHLLNINENDLVIFLHVDCLLSQEGYHVLLDKIKSGSVKAGCFTFALLDRPPFWGRWFEFFTNVRSRLLGLPYGDQAFFATGATIKKMKQYKDIPLCEDVEWHLRVKKITQPIQLPFPVKSSARRFQRRGWIKSAFLNLSLVCLFRMGVSPNALHKIYHRMG